MSARDLPDVGDVDAATADETADIVEDLADDAEAGTGRSLLIALDIDGTVLLEDESFSPGVVDAVRDAHEAGHEIMLATGRAWESTRQIMSDLGLEPEFAVCSNGAVVMRRLEGDPVEYERHVVETFDPAEVLELVRTHLPGGRYMVELADGERLFTEDMHDWNLSRAREVAFEDLAHEPVSRVVVVSPEESPEDFLELVEGIGLGGVSYAVGWSAWLDIAPHGVDKATGLEYVREQLGVAPRDVLVIGDGRNDLGMFRWAREHGGRAIAMAQAPEVVQAEASEATGSVYEGGVAAILRGL